MPCDLSLCGGFGLSGSWEDAGDGYLEVRLRSARTAAFSNGHLVEQWFWPRGCVGKSCECCVPRKFSELEPLRGLFVIGQ